MKTVLLINGSPHEAGCTRTALEEVAEALERHGLATRFFNLGTGPVHGCTACGACTELKRCALEDDACNELLDLMQQADAVVIGSPVYYAGPNGALCALLDRVFFASQGSLAHKPAAAVVNCRRGGASATFDRLNKYFTINRMPVVSSQYWNSTHGFTPDQVRQDAEGLQTMRTLGDNLAWLLLSLEKAGLEPPLPEPWTPTHFIR
ncbi:MAG: flavodoxin family protein [Candidatus Xenobium sp.]|nr:flavodoxin family protein [Burkholderiales bacterium]